MRARLTTALLLGAMLLAALPAMAQAPRQDVFWARSTNGAPITLDGVLSEPQWAAAESVVIRYSVDTGIPGSGWKSEGGFPATDPTYATLRFLTVGNQLYMAAVVRDSSIGGSEVFNRFDALLMSIKDHLASGSPKGPAEYFYSWWYQNQVGGSTPPPGQQPNFQGRWGAVPPALRTPAQIAAWDAVTTLTGGIGLTNADTPASSIDKGWITEMKFDLGVMGYDVTQSAGDIIEFNISIYDADWAWPLSLAKLYSANRVWWQSPWGNAMWYGEVRMYARPDVNVSSGALPTVGPELRLPNLGSLPAPVIDGTLSEAVWASAPSVRITYDDNALRASYPGVGKWRSGQYQPPVNATTAFVQDPGDATVKYFFKGDVLYLGFDVNDQVVQYSANFDQQDGFIVSIDDRFLRGGDQNLLPRRLIFQVGADGKLLPEDFMINAVNPDSGYVQAALALKPGTVIDPPGNNPDTGYTAEMAINLLKFGYPPGRGDGTVFLGVDLLDGDSFIPSSDDYGTRTWWFSETETVCCPGWFYMDPSLYVTTGVGDPGSSGVTAFSLLGNSPNPFKNYTTIRYALPQASNVTLEVYDVQGRMVQHRVLGLQAGGERSVRVERLGTSGLYMYRLRLTDRLTGATRAALAGKLMFMQ